MLGFAPISSTPISALPAVVSTGPTLVASGTSASTATELTRNITLPTWSVGANDWIFLEFASGAGVSSPTATPTASGYTEVFLRRNTNGSTMGLYVKQAVSGDSGSTVGTTYAAAQTMSWKVRIYSGSGGLGAVAITPSTDTSLAATTSPATPAITPNVSSGSVIASMFTSRVTANGTASTVTTPPAGLTDPLEAATTAASTTNHRAASYDTGSYSSPTASQTAVYSATGYTVSATYEVLAAAGGPILQDLTASLGFSTASAPDLCTNGGFEVDTAPPATRGRAGARSGSATASSG